MPLSRSLPASLRRCSGVAHLLGRACRSQDGATAVEFALIALPFFALVFAIIEAALGFWATQALEVAVANASRHVYTGQFQTDPANAGQSAAQLATTFKNRVCRDITALFKCDTLLKVDVRAFSSSSNASVPSPITNGAFDPSGFGYWPLSGQSHIGPDQIVVVRAALEYPVIVPITKFGNLSNGNRLIMASAAFRTEPFPSN